MSTKQFIIDPDAKLDYGFNWSGWLPTGATIATSTWTVTPTGPATGSETNSSTQTVVWVSGCTSGVTYTLTNSIVDSAGREDDRSMTLVCRER
jgi:hypothetical protein